jgi:hypothetical protein
VGLCLRADLVCRSAVQRGADGGQKDHLVKQCRNLRPQKYGRAL